MSTDRDQSGPDQSGPIAVYGATGYTGKLIAAELARSGHEFALAGRSREKLEALADELGIDVPLHPIAISESRALCDLFGNSAVVIACAGPFHLHGEPVLAAAVATGTPCFDTTGEQPFIRKALQEYGPRAAKAGSAVVPGMGFDYVPGDMLAALTTEGMGPLERLRLAYHDRLQTDPGHHAFRPGDDQGR